MESLITTLGDKGILGIFSALLILTLIYIFKMMIAQVEKRLEQTQKDLDTERAARVDLQKRFDDYIAEDRTKILDALNRATEAIQLAMARKG
jgi:type II secretory pathway component PulM